MFGTMTTLWKMFYYSPKKAEALKIVQSVLGLPELKILKPSDTRWLSHERCVQAIRKELPALICTLHQLYNDSGDTEAYGLALVLSSYSGVATIVFLSVVLDLLAKLNCFLQRKATDFSRLPIVLKNILSEVKHLKDDGAEWCSLVEKTVVMLESEHEITLTMGGTRSCTAGASTLTRYRKEVVSPYIDTLVSNITSRFSDQAVQLLVSSSIFNPVSFPAALPEYGNKELQVLVDFYGKEATAEFVGTTVTSPPLVDGEEVLAEWRVFKRAFATELKSFMEHSRRRERTASHQPYKNLREKWRSQALIQTSFLKFSSC